MADEVNIAQWLNTKGFTVKLYDEATTDIATTIYPTGGYSIDRMDENWLENTIMIRYKGVNPIEINTRMETIKNLLLNLKSTDIEGIAGVTLQSDKLALGKDATGHFFFSQNFIYMKNI